MLDPFHIVIQGRPSDAAESEGRLTISQNQMALPLATTFDAAYQQLEALELFIEPDGAFLWTGWDKTVEPPAELWRLDGCLFDSGPSLQYVEVKGHCGWEPWRKVLEALEANEATTMIQHVEQGEFWTLDRFATSCLRA